MQREKNRLNKYRGFMDINEYNKYKNDKIKFAEKCFTAVDKNRGKYVKKPLYDHQKVILKEKEWLLIQKSRLVGISEIFAFDIAHNLNYQSDCNMLVVCPNNAMATKMKNKVVRHFSNIPDNIRVGLTATFKNSYATNIHSNVEFKGSDLQSLAHSTTYDIIYIDESYYMDYFDRIFIAISAALSRKGKIIISSGPGPNAVSNAYFQTLWKSKNKFNKLVVTSTDTSYIEDEKTLNNLTKEQYDSIIYDCVF